MVVFNKPGWKPTTNAQQRNTTSLTKSTLTNNRAHVFPIPASKRFEKCQGKEEVRKGGRALSFLEPV